MININSLFFICLSFLYFTIIFNYYFLIISSFQTFLFPLYKFYSSPLHSSLQQFLFLKKKFTFPLFAISSLSSSSVLHVAQGTICISNQKTRYHYSVGLFCTYFYDLRFLFSVLRVFFASIHLIFRVSSFCFYFFNFPFILQKVTYFIFFLENGPANYYHL